MKSHAGKASDLTLHVSAFQSAALGLGTSAPLYGGQRSPFSGKQERCVETRFGVRDIEWKPETGMWLNGKNVKLQGVCNHQDAGALGAAVPDKILRFRIEQLKAMGCNAIRTSHNPQTPVFYDICDEVGMLVMDEIFDGWMKKGDARLWRTLVRRMVGAGSDRLDQTRPQPPFRRHLQRWQ